MAASVVFERGKHPVVRLVPFEGVALGVLGGEAGAIVEGVGGAPLLDGGVEPVLDHGTVALGAPVLAEQAAVDLGDAEAGGLELALGDAASLFGEAKYTYLEEVEGSAKAGGDSESIDDGKLSGLGANVGILLKW